MVGYGEDVGVPGVAEGGGEGFGDGAEGDVDDSGEGLEGAVGGGRGRRA